MDGEIRIFEYFEKWKKSMVLCGREPQHKAHQSGKGKVREDRMAGMFQPGPW